MKRTLLLLIFTLIYIKSFTQQERITLNNFEQQLEIQAEKEESENEEDSFIQHLQYLIKRPLNLNEADENDLKELLFLNELQIKNFLIYRRLFGKLLNILELQAVPTWNINIIQKLLPFIKVSDNERFVENIRERWIIGEHNLQLKASRILEKSKGFQSSADSGNSFLGNEVSLYTRYKYNYKNLMQWGWLGDKDAGEQFFKGKQKGGFDFYSFHFFVRKLGIFKALAIGDFKVNMGQGLIQWQSFAFKKSADITALKRQSPVLNPYTSAGEFNFHRGVGATFQKRKWEATFFISLRKLSSNAITDSLHNAIFFSSLLTSGYHRTENELSDRNNLTQFTAGGSFRYASEKGHIGANAIHYKFSRSQKKQDQPFNLFAFQGRSLRNTSIDYSYTYKNIHFFGEAAIDNNNSKAFLNGVLISPDPKMNVSLLHRSIDRSYQSFYSNAFTENTFPSNEKGMYAGVSFRPSDFLTFNGYTDVFRFPWLKYRVDAPSSGKDYFVQLTYTPAKRVEIYSHYRNELKQINRSGSDNTTKIIDNTIKQNWRIQSIVSLSTVFNIRNRCEVTWYNKNGPGKEQGFLMFMDIYYKPPFKPWSANMRLLYFETEGYQSRIYAYENDVMYNFSIPAFFDKGYRYCLNLHGNLTQLRKYSVTRKIKIECWFRLAQTIYPRNITVSPGPDKKKSGNKTEIKCQFILAL